MRVEWLLPVAIFAARGLANDQQQPLSDLTSSISKDEVIQRLKLSLIIPHVVDDFLPTVKLQLSWKNATSQYGNIIDPDELQKQPSISLHDWRDTASVNKKKHKHKKHKDHEKQPEFVVVLTDPDAPSFTDPKWSQVCHWITARVPVSIDEEAEDIDVLSHKPHSVVDYKPPGPPPKTGLHRYVALALTARNGTTHKLHLSTPSSRQHWGYKGDRAGVREWALENGLAVVGANFIFAKNHKQ